MNGFFIETEAKLFCLLIIGFLWVFRRKNLQKEWRKLKFVYVFSCIGILMSVAGDIAAAFTKKLFMQNLCDVGFGLCYALSVYFWCAYIGGIKQYKKTVFHNIISYFIAAVFGVFSYFSSKYDINAGIYISVFAVITAFIVSQYNKIRIDNLTKLYNRYGMDEEIREQLQQYARDKNDSFYIIACDLDNFKHINDTWGHLEGDRALILISAALSKVGKMFDAEVFRIGGDEFVIITDTSEEGLAIDITDAIKNELDNIDFRDDFDIKMSMGVALYDGVTHINTLLNNADKKLYEAKKNNKKA